MTTIEDLTQEYESLFEREVFVLFMFIYLQLINFNR